MTAQLTGLSLPASFSSINALSNVTLVAMAVTIIAPRAAPIGILFVGIVQLLRLIIEDRIAHVAAPHDARWVGLSALLSFSAVSAIWAGVPSAAILASGGGVLFFMTGHLLWRAISTEPVANTAFLMRSLLIGFSVGLVYLAIELSTDLLIRRIFRQLVTSQETSWAVAPPLERFELNRSIAVTTIIFWPMLLGLRAMLPRSVCNVVAVLAFLISAILIFASTHETSKLAFVIGLFIFAGANWKPRLTIWMLSRGWIAMTILVIPMAYSLYYLKTHEASWLQKSAQARIVIWRHTAEQVIKAPILGHGADNTRFDKLREPPIQRDPHAAKVHHQAPTVSHHAHNIFLQVWYELGAVGALCWLMLGLQVLASAEKLNTKAQPYALAAIGIVFVEMTATFSVWQSWFNALLTVLAFILVVAARSSFFSNHRNVGTDGAT